jgi:hypothetical protein
MSLRPMAPRSLPAATLAATMLLAFACPAASADQAGDAPAATSGPGAGEAPAAGDTEAPAPADTTGGDVQALAQGAQSAAAGEQAEVLPGSTVAQQGGGEAPPAPPTSPPEAAPATPPPPAAPGEEEATTTDTRSTADPPPPPEQPSRSDPRPLAPAPPSTPPKAEVSKVVVTSTAPEPPTTTAAPPESSLPPPVGGAPAPERENKLARLLTDADRGLREVQGQIGTLKRRLGTGDLPPTAGLVRLQQGLDRLAPVLLALEARLDMAPRLTPRLKALLHRVHSRLERTQDSAGDLIAAFVRSGAGGPALRLLLRELERFVAFDSTPAPTLGAPPVATPASGPLGTPAPGPLAAQKHDPYTAYTQIGAAPAAAPRDGVADLSPGRRGDGRHRAGQKVPGGPDQVPPSSPASASASATPGGAFSAAGLAALAALVAALARPALRMRLDLVAGRPYRAAFASPLERPG